MAVPAHDQRDWEFAKTFSLPVRQVITGGNIEQAASVDLERGTVVNSTAPNRSFSIDGLKPAEAIPKITDWLESEGTGRKAINYKLRDWLFARQRYWGEPFPIVWVTTSPNRFPRNDFRCFYLKRRTSNLREQEKVLSPIFRNGHDHRSGNRGVRAQGNEYHAAMGGVLLVLPQVYRSRNSQALLDSSKERYWMPVDLYIGGAEHAVLHLLYARFWHKVLFDIGVVSTPEPFMKLVHQGIVLGEDNQKMSKSRGNVVNPDEMIDRFGADAVDCMKCSWGPWNPRSRGAPGG